MTRQQMNSIEFAMDHLLKQEQDAKLVLAEVQRQVEKRREELQAICDHTDPLGYLTFDLFQCRVCGKREE